MQFDGIPFTLRELQFPGTVLERTLFFWFEHRGFERGLQTERVLQIPQGLHQAVKLTCKQDMESISLCYVQRNSWVLLDLSEPALYCLQKRRWPRVVQRFCAQCASSHAFVSHHICPVRESDADSQEAAERLLRGRMLTSTQRSPEKRQAMYSIL
jgi:hypothetical protein